jgi:uncharacterized protein (DUF4415 family)
MKKEYDFSKGQRGPVVEGRGKTRVTMYLDNEVLEEFRNRAEKAGKGYQTLINDALRDHLSHGDPVNAKTLRRIIREELKRTGT